MTRTRGIELAITLVLLMVFAALLTWAVVVGHVLTWSDALVRFAFAIVVALGVRWLGILFESLPSVEDIYRSNSETLRAKLDQAKSRIWILQTWLPQIDADAGRILDARAPDKRVILGSYRFDRDATELSSAMYARIRTREIDPRTAMGNSSSSFMPFFRKGKVDVVRFNPVHHPGWIAVIDSDVFWGQTPLDADNWNVPQVCHHARATEWRAEYWVSQFLFLWEGKDDSGRPWLHGLETELQYNAVLRERIGTAQQGDAAVAASPHR